MEQTEQREHKKLGLCISAMVLGRVRRQAAVNIVVHGPRIE